MLVIRKIALDPRCHSVGVGCQYARRTTGACRSQDLGKQCPVPEQMPFSGGSQYIRVGETGPTVVQLHGCGDTDNMWEPLSEVFAASDVCGAIVRNFGHWIMGEQPDQTAALFALFIGK